MINGAVIFNVTLGNRNASVLLNNGTISFNGVVFFVRLYYIIFIYFNKLFISINKKIGRRWLGP